MNPESLTGNPLSTNGCGVATPAHTSVSSDNIHGYATCGIHEGGGGGGHQGRQCDKENRFVSSKKWK